MRNYSGNPNNITTPLTQGIISAAAGAGGFVLLGTSASHGFASFDYVTVTGVGGTTEANTTQSTNTTTTVDVGERIRPLLVRGDAAALDLAAPGSAAHLYIDGIVLSTAYGAPSTGPRFDDFALDDGIFDADAEMKRERE